MVRAEPGQREPPPLRLQALACRVATVAPGWQVVEGLTSKTQGGETLRVREVWRDNLDDEMDIIRGIVDEYPFVAMDTEFPGVVARPVGQFKNSGEYHYQTLRRGPALGTGLPGPCFGTRCSLVRVSGTVVEGRLQPLHRLLQPGLARTLAYMYRKPEFDSTAPGLAC